mmetsp:Transcript_10349/g.40434  ORF Transcript_10349/g.40434 Transcript_10349/m.40434 type:complete len:323 (+) Transcript_10349:786-1754(+)
MNESERRFEPRRVGVVRAAPRRVPQRLVRGRYPSKLRLGSGQRVAALVLPLIGVPLSGGSAVPAANLLRRRIRGDAQDFIKRAGSPVHRAAADRLALVRPAVRLGLYRSCRGEHLPRDLRVVRRRRLRLAKPQEGSLDVAPVPRDVGEDPPRLHVARVDGDALLQVSLGIEAPVVVVFVPLGTLSVVPEPVEPRERPRAKQIGSAPIRIRLAAGCAPGAPQPPLIPELQRGGERAFSGLETAVLDVRLAAVREFLEPREPGAELDDLPGRRRHRRQPSERVVDTRQTGAPPRDLRREVRAIGAVRVQLCRRRRRAIQPAAEH